VTKFLFCISLVLLYPIVVDADNYQEMKALTGKFSFIGKSLVDPPPGEPRDTHFTIYLTGDAAKALYEKMEVKPEAERCEREEGVVSKYIQDMQCRYTAKANKYECFFAINVKEQRIEGGWLC